MGLFKPPTDSLRPVIPDNAWGARITAPAGTSLGTPYSSSTVTQPLRAGFILDKSGLQTEVLLPARGVARSGFRPLSKVLDCCLP